MATPASDVAKYVGLTRQRVMQIVREAGWPVVKQPNGYVHIPAETIRLLHASRGTQFRPTVVTIGIQKGGVGKSLLSINTALAGAQKGARVLLIDLDPEACATQYLAGDSFDLSKARTIYEVIKDGIPIKEVIVPSKFDSVSFVPCRSMARRVDALVVSENPATLLAEKINDIRADFDLILFDVSPSFSNLIASAYLTSETVICPVNSDVWSFESLVLTSEDIAASAKKWRCPAPTIRVVRNKVAPPQRRDTREAETELAKDFASELIDISIKASSALSNAINDGVSIFEVRGTAELRSNFVQLFDYLCPLEPVSTTNEPRLKPVHRSDSATKSPQSVKGPRRRRPGGNEVPLT